MFWRATQAILLVVNTALAVFLLLFMVKGSNGGIQQGLEYKDFVSILLTAIGVMIAIAALFLAILAIWGYQAGRLLVIESSERVALDRVDKIVPERLDAIVPGLVEDALRFRRQAGNDGNADEIAEAYTKEPGG